MQCKNCGGALAMRSTREYPIDDNGVWTQNLATPTTSGVYCLDCGAGHAYEEIHRSGDSSTVALATNSDPKPVATIAIGFRSGVIDSIGAEPLVGVIAIDEDKEEVGMFLGRNSADQKEWWERANQLAGLIKKGEWRASFAQEENDA